MRLDGVYHDTNAQTQECINLPHPLGVTACQVIVDGDDMYALTGQRVQVDRQGGNKRLPFTGLHLSNFALVQDNATNKLYVIVTHLDSAPAHLAHNGKSLGQEILKRLPCFVAFGHLRYQRIHRLSLEGHNFRLQVCDNLAKELF